MPESKEDAEKRALRELEAKNVANYSIMLQAWIETRMARDKTLVTLSAGGIGVLITLLTTVGVSRFRFWHIALYTLSFLGFLMTIGLALYVYQLNSQMIENDMRGKYDHDLKLRLWDKMLLVFFASGAIFAFATAVTSALTHPSQERSVMANHEKKSLDGLSNLKPQPSQSQPPQPQPSGPAPAQPIARPESVPPAPKDK